MNNIYLTNVNQSGDDVMVFTNLAAETLAASYKKTSITFDECYAVKDDDVKFYIYEPCWLTPAEEERARVMAKHAEEEAQALGFTDAKAASDHHKWLETNGSPEFKKWNSEIQTDKAIRPCAHNSMVANADPKHAFKCADCNYVYGN
jgi:hypothetical protein